MEIGVCQEGRAAAAGCNEEKSAAAASRWQGLLARGHGGRQARQESAVNKPGTLTNPQRERRLCRLTAGLTILRLGWAREAHLPACKYRGQGEGDST